MHGWWTKHWPNDKICGNTMGLTTQKQHTTFYMRELWGDVFETKTTAMIRSIIFILLSIFSPLETIATSVLMVFAVMLCYLSSSDRSAWNIQAWVGLEPCLRWGAVFQFHQLSYRVNWELNIICVYDKPIDCRYMPFNNLNWGGNNFNVNDLRGLVLLRQL